MEPIQFGWARLKAAVNPKQENPTMPRTIHDMTENQWVPMYRRCMALSEAAGKAEFRNADPKDVKRQMKKFGFFFSHDARKWVDLWAEFCKGNITEEELKATFLVYS